MGIKEDAKIFITRSLSDCSEDNYTHLVVEHSLGHGDMRLYLCTDEEQEDTDPFDWLTWKQTDSFEPSWFEAFNKFQELLINSDKAKADYKEVVEIILSNLALALYELKYEGVLKRLGFISDLKLGVVTEDDETIELCYDRVNTIINQINSGEKLQIPNSIDEYIVEPELTDAEISANAILKGDVTFFENKIKENGDPNISPGFINSCAAGQTDLIKLFIKHNIDLSLIGPNGDCVMTYLVFATQFDKGEEEIIDALKLFFEAGYTLCNDASVLKLIVYKDLTEVLIFIISNGADVNALDSLSKNCLQVLTHDENSCFEYLLNNTEIKVNNKDKLGKTVLDIAIRKNQVNNINLLKSFGAKPGQEL